MFKESWIPEGKLKDGITVYAGPFSGDPRGYGPYSLLAIRGEMFYMLHSPADITADQIVELREIAERHLAEQAQRGS